jgi:hypothetical protein
MCELYLHPLCSVSRRYSILLNSSFSSKGNLWHVFLLRYWISLPTDKVPRKYLSKKVLVDTDTAACILAVQQLSRYYPYTIFYRHDALHVCNYTYSTEVNGVLFALIRLSSIGLFSYFSHTIVLFFVLHQIIRSYIATHIASSHTLWHIAVAAAACVWFFTLLDYQAMMQNTGCAPFVDQKLWYAV